MSVNVHESESPLKFLFWDLTAFKFHLHPVPERNIVLGREQKKSKTLIEICTNALVKCLNTWGIKLKLLCLEDRCIKVGHKVIETL